MRWLAAVAWVVVAAALTPQPASAQTCRRTCAANEILNGRGCCVADPSYVAPKAAPAKPKTSPARPPKVKQARTTPPAGTPAKSEPAKSEPARAEPAKTEPVATKGGRRTTADRIDGCRQKSRGDCDVLTMLDDSDLGLDDESRAELFVEGCAAGSARSCTRAGAMAEKGTGTKQNFTHARELYKKGCDGNDMVGCERLGQVYFLALGVVKDWEQAERLFKKACDGGAAGGCNDLGYLAEQRRDWGAAIKWYAMACDQRSGTGCSNAATLAAKAEVHDLAAQYRKKACALGERSQCY